MGEIKLSTVPKLNLPNALRKDSLCKQNVVPEKLKAREESFKKHKKELLEKMKNIADLDWFDPRVDFDNGD